MTMSKLINRLLYRSRTERCLHLMIAIAFGFLGALSFASPGSTDELYFKSGYSQTAVIIRETDTSITFKSEMGMSTIPKEKLDFIEEATKEENRELLKKWREKELRRQEEQEARREANRAFRKEQKAKGLVEFEGEWMTPEEKKDILKLRERALEHFHQFEEEQKAKGLVRFQHIWVTAERAEELREMESQILRLSIELKDLKETRDALRSAMSKATTIDEADRFSERIEETSDAVDDVSEKLSKLFEKADEIEATSVRYVAPEEFQDAFVSPTE